MIMTPRTATITQAEQYYSDPNIMNDAEQHPIQQE